MSKVLKAQQMSLTPTSFSIPLAPIQPPRGELPPPDPEWEAMRSNALAEAEAIRAAAHADAERIVQEAQATASGLMEAERARVEAILADEVEAAKRSGYEAGLVEARQAIEAEYAERFVQIENVYLMAQDERRRYLAESEPLIVDLACAVARKIMLRDSGAEREWVLDVVRTALEEIIDAGKVEVRVHPDDFELVHQNRGSLRKEVPGQTEVSVLADRGVGTGGCVIHTAYGNIDARIDTQLEEVKKALREIAASLEL